MPKKDILVKNEADPSNSETRHADRPFQHIRLQLLSWLLPAREWTHGLLAIPVFRRAAGASDCAPVCSLAVPREHGIPSVQTSADHSCRRQPVCHGSRGGEAGHHPCSTLAMPPTICARRRHRWANLYMPGFSKKILSITQPPSNSQDSMPLHVIDNASARFCSFI